MKYTMRDLVERAEHFESGLNESYKIDNHTIALLSIWSYGGGRDGHLVSVYVDGKMIATRCRRDTGLRKALETLNA